MSKKITETVWNLAEPVVQQLGLRIWDVEYVREGADWYLRIYIDKDEPVDIDDCERVSRAMDPILDEADPVPTAYIFEVCSPGCERVLKRPGDFEQFLGSQVLVKLYRAVEGKKEYVGMLRAYDNGNITIETDQNDVTFTPDEVALVRLYVEF